MLFCSWTFAQFFLIVFAVYWIVPWQRLDGIVRIFGRTLTIRGDEIRIWWLLAASFYFYASWNAQLALLIGVTTLMDYGIGLGMEASTNPRLRRCLLLCSLVGNLGMLAYFRYMNFFLDSLQHIGISHSIALREIILPVGISFYTFEAINYTVEVYRRRIPAERNPVHLLFFVLFFPHLIAGPIVRARDFLPQIRRRKRWSWPRVQLGVEYFLLGLIKKWVLADQLAGYADPVFAAPGDYGTWANWLGLLAFTIQVFCDISGYSDMALGTAHMLGFKLAINFNMPYLATSVADYWRRNHISLSTWLRDYLFIPLGGNRGSKWRTALNTMITMTLGGLWHGASWNFVLWGAMHGIYLNVHRGFRTFCETRPRLGTLLQTTLGTAARMVLTFFCIYQGFVLFRAQTFADAMTMMHRLYVFTPGPMAPNAYGYSLFWILVTGFFVAHVAACRQWWTRISLRMPAPVIGTSYVVAMLVCMLMAPNTEKPFIYFQF